MNSMFQMSSSYSLEAIKRGVSLSGPYTKLLKVTVTNVSARGWVKYTYATGYEGMKLRCMVADASGFARCIAYNEKFTAALVEGATIAIRNPLYKEGTLRLTAQSKVLRYV